MEPTYPSYRTEQMGLPGCKMRRTPTTAVGVAIGALVWVILLSGCGGSSKTAPTGTTGTSGHAAAERSETVPKTSIEASIPVVVGEHVIPARYTCDGGNVSLPVQWSLIPKGTAEIVMFLIKLKSSGKGTFFDWAVAGLSPTSHGVSAGTLPAGAVVGRNSFGQDGYSVCPPKGSKEEIFVLRVVALPHPLAAKSGFDAEAFYKEAERSTKVVGITGGVYTRR